MTEVVSKTKNGNETIRSRADIVYIRDGKMKIGEVKTGENSKLSELQNILKEAHEEGNTEPTKEKFIKLLKKK
ncbi:hypothetical protein [Bartonella sp. B1099]|uniref:hypothetical protein n=1 Tax=Bartonella sp. B1099 TaxID=2911422 RepID=UPI0020C1E633|nr:hypothetical protein [Bartonella sp. B1099]